MRSVVTQYQGVVNQYFEQLALSDLELVVQMIMETYQRGGHLYHMGVGKSGNIGKHFSDMLRSVSIPSQFLEPTNALHGDLGSLQKQDLLLVYSKSGSTGEIKKFLTHFRKGSPVLGLFSVRDCPLAELCTRNVVVPCSEEIDAGFNLMPTSSVVSFTLFTSICFSEIVARLQISPEEYGTNHPMGSIGRKLLYTVSDAMIPFEKLCRIKKDQTVEETVHQMLASQAGYALVTKGSKLLGLFQSSMLEAIRPEEYERPIHKFMDPKPFFITNPKLKLFQLQTEEYPYVPVVVENELKGLIARD